MAAILRNLFLLAICFIFPCSALAAHIDLAWDPNSEHDLAGYIVYYGTSSRNYTDWINVGKATSVRITGLLDDTEYFLALIAYDLSGNESDFSAEVAGYALPGDDQYPGVSFQATSNGGCFISTVKNPSAFCNYDIKR